MPWTAEDTERHTKKDDDLRCQRMWAEIANSVLSDTGMKDARSARQAVAKDFAKSIRP